MALKTPKDFRWKIGNTLGEGGQACVYEVTDVTGKMGGCYAMKPLSPRKPPKAYERFEREIRAISQLTHPGVVRVVDYSQPGDEFQFYVMERHENSTTLAKLLRSDRNPFFNNVEKSLKFFRQLLEAISAWNAVGIIHRDLSPANVLVLPDESIKVIDFGLCQLEGESPITLSDEGVGTANYMAPECESGSVERISLAADLYSAGKLLWAAITDRNAFARESPVFNEKSMKVMLPQNSHALHLHHLFEGTIRHSESDRWCNAEEGLSALSRVEKLVASYRPLELLDDSCPHCGVGVLRHFEGGHVVFGNPNPPGINSLQCPVCGFCFAASSRILQKELERRKSLQ